MSVRNLVLLLLASAFVLSSAPALASESPSDVMKRFRAVARSGDVDGFKAFIHPAKGLKDETTKVKRKHVTEKYMMQAEFLKTARRDKKAVCGNWKRGKMSCTVNLGNAGGHSYHFAKSKKGVFLLKARIFDG